MSSSCRNLQSPVTTAFHRLESSSSSSSESPSFKYPKPLLVAAVGGATLLLTGSYMHLSRTATHCEEEAASPNELLQGSAVDEKEEDEPYGNLPEHDAETTCLLCKTHRQGPCRKQWRNFEYCAKDLKVAINSSEACDCYIKPFEKCWMKNLNLYVLIANTVNQELIDDIEQDFYPGHLRRAFATASIRPLMDWSKWMSYLQTASTERETKQELDNNAASNNNSSNNNNKIALDKLVEEYETKMSSSSSNKHLWECFDELHLEPNLVTVTSQIPIRIIQDDESLILRVVYAVDQDNRAVGYSEYYSPSREHEDDKDNDKEQQKGEKQQKQQDHHVLACCLLPGITRAVRISAVYAKEESLSQQVDVNIASSADDEDTQPLAFLYTTPWTFLPSSSSSSSATNERGFV
jgi:hypothetical protein